MIRGFFLLIALLFASPALAQTFPPLTGRVVDRAELLTPQQETELTQRLQALEQAASRQLVVVTVPDLQGYDIAEYGVGLGRQWNIGQQGANNGAILIVAVAERKVRIEVGYGLEGILTDALSSQIINRDITPRFRENDYAGGISAGVNAIIEQLRAPPEAAEQRALAAAQAERGNRRSGGGSIAPIIFWIVVLGFTLVSMLGRGVSGRRYQGQTARGRRGRRGRGLPVVIWGPGAGGGGWGGGSSWGGGSGGGWGGGGGGFSGGGGSFGGGGASGGW